MNHQNLTISATDLHKLLTGATPESTLLYLFLADGGDLNQAEFTLRLPKATLDIALANLRQLGLYQEVKPSYVVGEPPRYSEADLSRELSESRDFPMLVGEIQQRFGRIFSAEELKTVLLFRNYLGLPPEVISTLFTFCLQRNQQRGRKRPSLYDIQREAYRWAEQGIDTLDEAIGYVQTQLERQHQIGLLAQILQISGRKLTSDEEKYLRTWLEWGFGQAEIQLAYEKTCLNIGSMKWPYCNSILKSWHGQNLLTVATIKAGDQKPGGKSPVPMGTGNDQNYGDLERQAIEKLKRDFG